MADNSGYYIPKFYNDSLDDPLLFDADLGILAVVNNMPEGFITTTQVPDQQNRCTGVDGVNKPRPGKDIIATIANCTYINGICHLKNNIFLIAATVSGSAKWYSLNNTTLTDVTAGGPVFTAGVPLVMDAGLTNIYVAYNSDLWKWDGTTWTKITIGTSVITGSAVMSSIVHYFAGAVTVAETGTNVLYFSNLLTDSSWDTTNLSVQLDQYLQDSITGFCPWQQFNLVVFKNSSTWSVSSNPSLIKTSPISRANMPINKISSTIGCCNHRTICQVDNDILFLSESGRGVFSVGQIATNEQQAIKNSISLAIKGYIDRINWQFINSAYAVAWDDLYILHVPLDGATLPNAALVYCPSLGNWQGIWTGYNSTAGDRQDSGNLSGTRYIFGDTSGNILSHYHQEDAIYVDTVAGSVGTGTPYFSSITTRGYRFDQEANLIQPFNFVYEFTNTLVPVNVQIVADQVNVGVAATINPSFAGPTIPFIIPFTLPLGGTSKQAVSARSSGICSQVQSVISGTGQWEIIKISPSAWVGRGVINSA
jgi:hypothetical protein